MTALSDAPRAFKGAVVGLGPFGYGQEAGRVMRMPTANGGPGRVTADRHGGAVVPRAPAKPSDPTIYDINPGGGGAP